MRVDVMEINLNNEIRNYRGEVIGFGCFTCGEMKDRMWGNKCNECRNKSDESAKLRAEIARLTEAVKQLSNPTRIGQKLKDDEK